MVLPCRRADQKGLIFIRKHTTPFLALLLGLGILFNACEQNEIVPPNNPPVDTTGTDTTSTDTTSLLPPPAAFDIVVTRIRAGSGGGGSISGSMIRLWYADYEIQSTDTVGVSYTWRSSVVAHNHALNELISYNQTAEVHYRTSSTDTITVTARRGNHTVVHSEVFAIDQVYPPVPPPTPSFDIYRVVYYQMPSTKADGSAWDDVLYPSDMTASPEFRIRTGVHEQLYPFSSQVYPDSQMVVRSDRIPTQFTTQGTPDYNLQGVTDLLLYEWDDVNVRDTVANLQFVAAQHQIPGSQFSTVTFQQSGFHIVVYLRYNN